MSRQQFDCWKYGISVNPKFDSNLHRHPSLRVYPRSNPLFGEEIASAEEHRLAMTDEPVIYLT
jgi:hypothetical protein